MAVRCLLFVLAPASVLHPASRRWWCSGRLPRKSSPTSSIRPGTSSQFHSRHQRARHLAAGPPSRARRICSRAISGLVWEDFGEFRNLFVYPDIPTNPAGTQTIHGRGHLLADSRLIDALKGGVGYITGYVIDAVHYGTDGKPIFRARSVIDSGGRKVRENRVQRQKAEEFYFIWNDLH